MGSVVLDITTRGLEEAHQNVKNIKNLITAGTARQLELWYNSECKNTMLSIIDSGEGMAANKEPYATWKRNRYGIDHPLGRLTGALYFSIESAQPTIKETRGKEVRLAVIFDSPHYLIYVKDGRTNQVERDFILLAREQTMESLRKRISGMFDNLDFTMPYPQLMNAILSYNGGGLSRVR